MFHYTIETDKSVVDAINLLQEELTSEGFGILWEFDIQDKLQEKGLAFEQEYYILEVCNPQEAQKVLEHNQLTGYFLPCKIAVYSDKDSRLTKIGLPKPTSLIDLAADEKLTEIAEDIEKRLINCIDNIK
ncbi:hypothetical protein Halha_2005 [Halobacteroides halobius DSM 5150]|uniref:DUF302 domain-containing protein n=1 Tax=Halobacteroides halobius (strain ATCC 35273 / DSM 5150 / MD-1) TaxID=748449 RepID=L0KC10_HALHC|nr:DUF302 domain-containing protein [Halobacteroides halobius]AGB41904.1 hypothetical protein Halha_2005 [Halobacteroides halobius DSM 5150]